MLKSMLEVTVIFFALVGALSVWSALVRVSTTYELDNGRLVTFSTDRSKCEIARAAIEADDGRFVQTTSPWGETYRVRRVWCNG